MELAVIKTGGKQYKVKKGDKLKVEKLPGSPGSMVEFESLLYADSDGKKVDVGKPNLTKKVSGKILSHGKNAKINIIKYKRKVRYRRKRGFRKDFTLVEITAI